MSRVVISLYRQIPDVQTLVGAFVLLLNFFRFISSTCTRVQFSFMNIFLVWHFRHILLWRPRFTRNNHSTCIWISSRQSSTAYRHWRIVQISLICGFCPNIFRFRSNTRTHTRSNDRNPSVGKSEALPELPEFKICTHNGRCQHILDD